VWLGRRFHLPGATPGSFPRARAGTVPGEPEGAWPSRPPGVDPEGHRDRCDRLVFEADAELGEELRRAALARGLPPEEFAADLLARGLEQEVLRGQAEAVLARLTRREQQVAWRAARGQTNRQIAETLVVSPETVKTHVAHVLEKLGVRSKADLRVLLLDLGVRWWEEKP
jgi:DNA-binding CsgD family transcriptional regulator